jgi:dihydrofolate reductase
MFDTPDENKAEVEQITSAGAYVMGRNMFGPVRGEWDLDWRGWWGDDPHYHAPVFVLTDHQRDPVTMRGRRHLHSSPMESTLLWTRRAPLPVSVT